MTDFNNVDTPTRREGGIPMFAPSTSFDVSQLLAAVIGRQRFILGEEVENFEHEFAAYVGVPECVGVANGTDALEIALRAVGVGAGDEVLMAANAGYYSSAATILTGAVPCYADVDPTSLCLSQTNVERALANEKLKAVIVTHLYGYMTDVEPIVALCSQRGIPVIEDCAQSHGAQRNGRRCGSVGSIGCFSFYPTKNLGALGDGGAITTTDSRIANRVRKLHQYGWNRKYHVEVAGGRNSRLDELQAAVLRARLPSLDAANARRRMVASRYNDAFRHLPLTCPSWTNHEYVAHLYVVRSELRSRLREFLSAHNVASEVHYPVADHLQEARSREQMASELKVTERACATVISLPCFPDMTDEMIEKVISTVSHFFEENPL